MRRFTRNYFVYIATNPVHTVLYTGVTNSILRRSFEHAAKESSQSFTAKYNIRKIVYYETYTDIKAAIAREKTIKGWTRAKKIALIESINSDWRDLMEDETDE